MFHFVMEPHQQPPSSHQISPHIFPLRKRSYEFFSNWNQSNSNEIAKSNSTNINNNINGNLNNNNTSHKIPHHEHPKKFSRGNSLSNFHSSENQQPPRKKFANGTNNLTQLLPSQHQQTNSSQIFSPGPLLGTSSLPSLNNLNSSPINTLPSSATVSPNSNPNLPTNNLSPSNQNNNSQISSPPHPPSLVSIGHSISFENLPKFLSSEMNLPVKHASSTPTLGSSELKQQLLTKKVPETKPNHNDIRRKHEEEYKMKQEKRKAEQMSVSRLAHYVTQDSLFWNFVIPTIPLFDDSNGVTTNSNTNTISNESPTLSLSNSLPTQSKIE